VKQGGQARAGLHSQRKQQRNDPEALVVSSSVSLGTSHNGFISTKLLL
jgi:hypothetical protein